MASAKARRQISACDTLLATHISQPYHPAMPVGMVERVGRNTNNVLAAFGDFFIFAGRAFMWLIITGLRPKSLRLLLPQMYEVGVRSVPVVGVTGAFIGMVLAIETHTQFKTIGQEYRPGSII